MIDLKNKTILVTGGAGFIGSHLVERLAADNEVYVMDALYSGAVVNIEQPLQSGKVRLIIDDVRNISKYKIAPDIVFHFGAYSSSQMYRDNPHLMAFAIDGMLSVLEYIKERKIPLVFASVATAYGDDAVIPSVELSDVGCGIHSQTYAVCEKLAADYSNWYGLDITVMRMFSIYGPREEAKGQYASAVTQFVALMKRGQTPAIYGDGTQRRDFVYVSDAVDAAILAATKVSGYNVYSVATGVETSLIDLVALINEIQKTGIKIASMSHQTPGHIRRALADTARVESILGFKASVNLEDGVKRVLEYTKVTGQRGISEQLDVSDSVKIDIVRGGNT